MGEETELLRVLLRQIVAVGAPEEVVDSTEKEFVAERAIGEDGGGSAGGQVAAEVGVLVHQAAERLVPGGHLLVEISPMIHEAARALVAADGRFQVGPTVMDLARLPRAVTASRA